MKTYKIAPLKWRKEFNQFSEVWTASSCLGTYSVWRSQGATGIGWGPWKLSVNLRDEHVISAAEGKRKAREHIESRILPAMIEVTK